MAYVEATQVKRKNRLERTKKMIGRKVWFPSDGPKGKIHMFEHLINDLF